MAIHLLERGVRRLAAFRGKGGLYALEAAGEFRICVAQARFRVDPEMPRDVCHHEEQVAELLTDFLRWRLSRVVAA